MQFQIVADESVDYRIVKGLRVAGFSVLSIIENSVSISDEEVLRTAVSNNALLITEDKDFGEPYSDSTGIILEYYCYGLGQKTLWRYLSKISLNITKCFRTSIQCLPNTGCESRTRRGAPLTCYHIFSRKSLRIYYRNHLHLEVVIGIK